MKVVLFASLTVLSTIALGAEPFDGSQPLSCAAAAAHDCTPDQNVCARVQADKVKPYILDVNFSEQTVRTPFRFEALPIQSTKSNQESLVIQGTNLEFAWSARIHRKTGTFTIAIADRLGSYVIFGQCKPKT